MASDFAEREPDLAKQIEAANIPRERIIEALRMLAKVAGVSVGVEAILLDGVVDK